MKKNIHKDLVATTLSKKINDQEGSNKRVMGSEQDVLGSGQEIKVSDQENKNVELESKSNEVSKPTKPFRPIKINVRDQFIHVLQMANLTSISNNGPQTLQDLFRILYPENLEQLRTPGEYESLLSLLSAELPFIDLFHKVEDHNLKVLNDLKKTSSEEVKKQLAFIEALRNKYYSLCYRVNRCRAKLICLRLLQEFAIEKYPLLGKRYTKLVANLNEKKIKTSFDLTNDRLYSFTSLMSTVSNHLKGVCAEIVAMLPGLHASYNINHYRDPFEDTRIKHAFTQHAFIGSLDKEPDYYYIIQLLRLPAQMSFFNEETHTSEGNTKPRVEQWEQYHYEMVNLIKFLSIGTQQLDIESMLESLKYSYSMNVPYKELFKPGYIMSRNTFSRLLFASEAFILQLYLFVGFYIT